MLEGINQWDSFFSKEEYDNVDKELLNHEWVFGASPNNNLLKGNKVRQFWYKNLMEAEYIKELFKFRTEDYLNAKVETMRLYANGQSHGMAGHIHTDVPPDEPGICGSIVYFFQADWKPEYGGHLIFLSPEDPNRVMLSIFPRSNSAVIFNSKLSHMAFDPSVYCTNQRISIAYKFRVKQ
jgi:Rps23 Pro-64 3,4-dihydroxylase Tpa1-like proline 4-hydroxylase